MTAAKQPSKHSRPSIEYRRRCGKGEFCNLAEFVSDEQSTVNKKQSSRRDEAKSSGIMSTAALISAVDQIWDCANRLSGLQLYTSKRNHNNILEEDFLHHLDGGKPFKSPISDVSKSFQSDQVVAAQSSSILCPEIRILRVTEKMAILGPKSKEDFVSLSCRALKGDANSLLWKKNSMGIQNCVGKGSIYFWMEEMVTDDHKYRDTGKGTENQEKFPGCFPHNSSGGSDGIISGVTTTGPSNSGFTRVECSSTVVKPEYAVSSNLRQTSFVSTGILPTNSDFNPEEDVRSDKPVSENPSCLSHQYDNIASKIGVSEQQEHLAIVEEWPEKESEQLNKELRSPSTEASRYALGKEEYAFAGALAGISVSLCLHPLDTIKTIIQSYHREKSISYVGTLVVSERVKYDKNCFNGAKLLQYPPKGCHFIYRGGGFTGFTGLYRGVASNIASSAPISALYTLTYESVKGALLQILPRDYCSLTHCIAGGCASVATSFIFTPSERIKQQMQVGSHYTSCWNAFVGIIQKGGLPSLYAGWCAVLCRNVPHSIIKFYAYERLKKHTMSSSVQSEMDLSTSHTLLCGGIAGSTAALFTTPFDVVKTRLQTQLPGCRSQYSNVFQALQVIGKQEGLKGLYRGLLPRLVMYMSQGAIFFSSYEFFKKMFSLKVPGLNFSRERKQDNEDAKHSSTPISESVSTSLSDSSA